MPDLVSQIRHFFIFRDHICVCLLTCISVLKNAHLQTRSTNICCDQSILCLLSCGNVAQLPQLHATATEKQPHPINTTIDTPDLAMRGLTTATPKLRHQAVENTLELPCASCWTGFYWRSYPSIFGSQLRHTANSLSSH